MLARFSAFQRQAAMLPLHRRFLFQSHQCMQTPFDYQQVYRAMNEVSPAFEIESPVEDEMQMKGRNSRRPKKANHGARPCSSFMRRMKKKGWYHIVRGE